MNSGLTQNVGIKQKLLHELKRLLLIAIYLALFFSLVRLYKRLLLEEYHVGVVVYGYVILQSLALAKIILTGEALRLDGWFRDKPLIVPTVVHTFVFCAFAWAFDVLEHFVVGTARGETPSDVLAHILEKGWPHMLAVTLVVFVAFLPFFAFREVERTLGEGKLRQLFLGRREAVKRGEPQDAAH
jgi:hypothetical protein